MANPTAVEQPQLRDGSTPLKGVADRVRKATVKASVINLTGTFRTMKWRLALVGLLVAAVLGVVYYSVSSREGFQAPDMDTFTMYYADWCPHCQKVKPEFKEFAGSGEVTVGGRRCRVRMIEADANKEELKGKPIQGFPTFLLEGADGRIVEYKGKRSTKGYLKFLEEELGLKQNVA